MYKYYFCMRACVNLYMLICKHRSMCVYVWNIYLTKYVGIFFKYIYWHAPLNYVCNSTCLYIEYCSDYLSWMIFTINFVSMHIWC